MENNISKMGSGLWSYDQHIDFGDFSPLSTGLMEEAIEWVLYLSVHLKGSLGFCVYAASLRKSVPGKPV